MPDFEKIQAGLNATRELTVDEQLAIRHTKVPVLGTPMMIGLMEIVSKDLVQPLLPDGFITVGYEVHVRHKAPAFVGSSISVSSRLAEVDGRRLLYEVRVTQGDTVIGEGTHRRTIIPFSD